MLTLLKICSFLRSQWRVILIGLIVGACLFKLNALINERDEYKDKYVAMVAAYEVAAEAMRVRDEVYKKTQVGILAERDAQYKALNLDRDKIRKALNEKISTNGSLFDALRVYQNRVNYSEAKQGEHNQESPKAERDCDGAITQLIDAGKSCAIDYKALYDDVKAYETTHNAE
jgi:hypothetical protein